MEAFVMPDIFKKLDELQSTAKTLGEESQGPNDLIAKVEERLRTCALGAATPSRRGRVATEE